MIYELHVGTFSPRGHVRRRDPAPRRRSPTSASTVIELMPVAEFPGARGWSYDGVYLSAAQSSYGGPHELQKLIDAAHALGLGVVLDVVYNHVGASGDAAITAFGPYFTHKHETPWGASLNVDGEHCDAVREWVCQSAEQWIRDFHLDGLRLDAIHAIVDSEPRAPRRRGRAPRPRDQPGRAGDRRVRPQRPEGHARARARRLRLRRRLGRRLPPRAARPAHRRDPGLVRGVRLDGAAGQGLQAPARPRRHLLRVPQAPLRRDRGRHPARALRRLLRRSRPDRQPRRSATACRSTRGRWRPSARFCHPSRRCCSRARSTASGRRFSSSRITSTPRSPTRPARAAGGSSPPSPRSRGEEVPDPQDVATFERSKLTRTASRTACYDLHAALLRARRDLLPAGDVDDVDYDERAGWLAVRRGEHTLLANFARIPVHVPARADRGSRPRHALAHARARLRRPCPLVRSARPLMEVWPGAPFPLGPTWDGEGTNFSIFSEHAERVELCLFDSEDRETCVELTERTSFNWHCYLPGVHAGQRYGYRVHGPVRPAVRAALQLREAADGPVREVDRGPDPVRRGQRAPVRAPRRRGRRPHARRRRRRGGDPEVRRHRPALRLAGRPPAEHAAGRQRHLRDPRQGLHDAAPRRARGPARHLRRAGVRRRPSAT